MRIYKIEVVSFGTYWIVNLNDRSGCSDVEKDCWQEAVFEVAAEDLANATGEIYLQYDKLNKDWTNSCDILYYDPDTVQVTDDDGDGEEILDYSFSIPHDGDGAVFAPKRYSKEV